MLVVAYRTAALYTQPQRQATFATPAAYGLDYQDIRLDTEDGIQLAAWYVPSHNRAALILVHGIGTNRADLLPIARDLAAKGHGLLLFDLRAHGESGGRFSTLGFHEVRDVRAALHYVEQRPEVDPERIAIYGNSLGAAVAIMAAADLPQLRAVVADSGFASVSWVVERQFNAVVRAPGWMAPLVVAIGSWQTGVDAADVAPVRSIPRISPRPIMIIHGEGDSTFLVDNARLLAEAAEPPKELWIVPAARHSGAYAADPQTYVERVSGFFERALR